MRSSDQFTFNGGTRRHHTETGGSKPKQPQYTNRDRKLKKQRSFTLPIQLPRNIASSLLIKMGLGLHRVSRIHHNTTRSTAQGNNLQIGGSKSSLQCGRQKKKRSTEDGSRSRRRGRRRGESGSRLGRRGSRRRRAGRRSPPPRTAP